MPSNEGWFIIVHNVQELLVRPDSWARRFCRRLSSGFPMPSFNRQKRMFISQLLRLQLPGFLQLNSCSSTLRQCILETPIFWKQTPLSFSSKEGDWTTHHQRAEAPVPLPLVGLELHSWILVVFWRLRKPENSEMDSKKNCLWKGNPLETSAVWLLPTSAQVHLTLNKQTKHFYRQVGRSPPFFCSWLVPTMRVIWGPMYNNLRGSKAPHFFRNL